MSDTVKKSKRKSAGGDYIVQGSILAAAAMIAKVIGVIYRIPLTNILGDEGNGYYGYAYQVYAFALMISCLSLPTAVSKLVSTRGPCASSGMQSVHLSAPWSLQRFVGCIIALAIFLGAGIISEHMMKAPLSIYALRVLAPGPSDCGGHGRDPGIFPGTRDNGAHSGLPGDRTDHQCGSQHRRGQRPFRNGQPARRTVQARTFSALHSVRPAELWAQCLAPLPDCFSCFSSSGFPAVVIRKRLRNDRSEQTESYSHIVKALLLTAVPIILQYSSLQYQSDHRPDRIQSCDGCPGFVESEYIALQGIYTGKYDPLVNVPMAIPNALCTSLVPSLTMVVIAGSRRKVHSQIGQILKLTTIITIPSCVGFFVLASPLMVLLYNDPSATPANLLMMGAVVIVLYGWGVDQQFHPARSELYVQSCQKCSRLHLLCI